MVTERAIAASNNSLMLRYANGDLNLTRREKAHIVRHEAFKEAYDARLFDIFHGIEEPDTTALRIMDLIAKRIGLLKPSTQVNVQVNNQKKDKAVTILVAK